MDRSKIEILNCSELLHENDIFQIRRVTSRVTRELLIMISCKDMEESKYFYDRIPTREVLIAEKEIHILNQKG